MNQIDNSLILDLTEEIKIIQTFNTMRRSKFEEFLSDACNKVYDTYDYITNDGNDKQLSIDQAKEMNIDLKRIKEQSTKLVFIIAEIDYDSKNMDRLKNMLLLMLLHGH
jgi:hypothetical protein